MMRIQVSEKTLICFVIDLGIFSLAGFIAWNFLYVNVNYSPHSQKDTEALSGGYGHANQTFMMAAS